MRIRWWIGLFFIAGSACAMIPVPDWMAALPPTWKVVWTGEGEAESVGSTYGHTLSSTIAPEMYVREAYDRAVVIDAITGNEIAAYPLDPEILSRPDGSGALFLTTIRRGDRRVLIAARSVNSAGPRRMRNSATDLETTRVWCVLADGTIAWTLTFGPHSYAPQFTPVPFGPDQTALFMRADDRIAVIDLDGRIMTEWTSPPPRRYIVGDFDNDSYPDVLVRERWPVRLRIGSPSNAAPEEEQP